MTLPEETPINKDTLFEYLIKYGGEIISSNSLDTENINQARASNRMWVDDNGYGFVWMPDIKEIPTTEEGVKFLEKWFPLQIKLPPDLTYENLLKRIDEKRQRKNN